MAVGVGDAVPVANPINPNNPNPATMVNGVVHGNVAETAANQEQLKAMEKYVVIVFVFRAEKHCCITFLQAAKTAGLFVGRRQKSRRQRSQREAAEEEEGSGEAPEG